MRDGMMAFVTTVSFASSAIFLYLTFNQEIDSMISTRFIFLTPFASGVMFGVGICMVFSIIKKRNATLRERQREDERILKKVRALKFWQRK